MCLGVCSHCTQFLKFELLCSQWDFQRGKSYFSYCTVCSLRADTMSNRSVSHKTPTLSFKKIYLLNIVWLCFFYKWKQDSCHLPQNALIIPPSLTYSFHRLAKPCLQLRGASTRVLLQHFKLYITKTQLTFHSNLFIFFCTGKTPFWAPESASRSQQDPLQLLLDPFHLCCPSVTA